MQLTAFSAPSLPHICKAHPRETFQENRDSSMVGTTASGASRRRYSSSWARSRASTLARSRGLSLQTWSRYAARSATEAISTAAQKTDFSGGCRFGLTRSLSRNALH
jgi:hypothetical protein